MTPIRAVPDKSKIVLSLEKGPDYSDTLQIHLPAHTNRKRLKNTVKMQYIKQTKSFPTLEIFSYFSLSKLKPFLECQSFFGSEQIRSANQKNDSACHPCYNHDDTDRKIRRACISHYFICSLCHPKTSFPINPPSPDRRFSSVTLQRVSY